MFAGKKYSEEEEKAAEGNRPGDEIEFIKNGVLAMFEDLLWKTVQKTPTYYACKFQMLE